MLRSAAARKRAPLWTGTIALTLLRGDAHLRPAISTARASSIRGPGSNRATGAAVNSRDELAPSRLLGAGSGDEGVGRHRGQNLRAPDRREVGRRMSAPLEKEEPLEPGRACAQLGNAPQAQLMAPFLEVVRNGGARSREVWKARATMSSRSRAVANSGATAGASSRVSTST